MHATKIFISYASADKNEMAQLVLKLQQGNLPLWRDGQDIHGGQDISQRLHEGFRESYCCISLLTEHTLASAWCMQEVGAFWGAGKPVIFYSKDQNILPPPLFALTKVVRDFHDLIQALNRIPIPPPSQFVQRVFPSSNHTDFVKCLKDMATRARRIRMIGTGLQIFGDANFREDILARAAMKECTLEIYLADPYNPAVEQRLVEENQGDEVPVEQGKDGIIRRAHLLAGRWNTYPAPKPDFPLRLFTRCPSFALLQFDDTLFFYPYGCKILGDHSPVFQISGDAPEWKDALEFFHLEFARVREMSTPYPRLAAHGRLTTVLDRELYGCAVYVIPRRVTKNKDEQRLYEFGTNILGYDVRSRRPLVSTWQDYVGNAKQFGFHLTLCDAVYFLTEEEVKTVTAEAEFVADDLSPFEITDLSVQRGVPNADSVAIEPMDPSGSMEALHHEFLHRINRRAYASNYTLELAPPVGAGDSERSRLMIRRYLAPCILKQFRPHFTLLTKVPKEPAGQRETVFTRIEELFAQQRIIMPIKIESLAIVTRKISKGRTDAAWTILKEINLRAAH